VLTQLCWQLAGRCNTKGTREAVGITIAVDAWMSTELVGEDLSKEGDAYVADETAGRGVVVNDFRERFFVGEDLSKEGDAYVADETAGRGVVVNDFRERFSVGEEVNKLGGEYIAAVLWIANDAGSGGVKPTETDTAEAIDADEPESDAADVIAAEEACVRLRVGVIPRVEDINGEETLLHDDITIGLIPCRTF